MAQDYFPTHLGSDERRLRQIRTGSIIILAIAIPAVLAAQSALSRAPQKQHWAEQTYPNDGFAITLPERVEPHEDSTLSVATFNAFTVTTPYAYSFPLSQDHRLGLHIVTFPNGCADFLSQFQNMVRRAKNGSFDTKKMGIRVEPSEQSRETEAAGYEAVESERDTGAKTHAYDRTQCVDKKLYVFSAVWPIGSKMPSDISRIIASFRILKQ